jgi:hypothetical protein
MFITVWITPKTSPAYRSEIVKNERQRKGMAGVFKLLAEGVR